MIAIGLVLSIHEVLIARFGGSSGLRDRKLLESAIERPFATFDQQELYPTIVEKAAAVFESIVKNHPFQDGNKRTAYLVMRYYLLIHEMDLMATEDKKYDFVIAAAAGEIDIEAITGWIREHATETKPV